MTGRERVLAAFAHLGPDLVPLDLGATAASAIEPSACAALCLHLGLTPTGDLDELLDVVEPDLGRLRLGKDGGVGLWRGRILPSSATLDDLERAPWPDVTDASWYEGLREVAADHRGRGRAVVLDSEIGLVDGCIRLRGTTAWLEDLLAAPTFAEALMERVAWTCGEVLRRALDVVGEFVDAVVIYEDLAGQTRTLMSPELYRRRVKPYQAALVDAIRSSSSATAVIHCDGAVADLLPDFVEIGAQAVNPVQTSALGMEPHHLQRQFGDQLCFWGGCDATATLAFGTPAQVETEALRALNAFSPGGSYVFGPTHPIDGSIPPENVLALVRAARSYRPA